MLENSETLKDTSDSAAEHIQVSNKANIMTTESRGTLEARDANVTTSEGNKDSTKPNKSATENQTVLEANVASSEANEGCSDSSDDDSVVNIYADIEPDEIVDVDFVSGKHLLPFNETLLEKITEYEKYGMFSNFQTEKIKTKVEDMKAKFLDGIKNTEYEGYFSLEDDWIAKGSSAEGSFYPCVFGLTEKHFKNVVLGDAYDQTAAERLDSFIKKHVHDSSTARFNQMVPDIDIMVSPKHLRFRSDDVLIPTKHTGYFNINTSDERIGPWNTCLESFVPQLSDNIHSQTQSTGETQNIEYAANVKILSPKKVKNIFHKSLLVMSKNYTTETTTMIVVPHGLAYQITVVNGENNQFTASQYDFALGVECRFWPSCANEWTTRKRLWPDEAEIRKIAEDGVNFMIKSPTGSLTTNLLWRVSFARAEYFLSRLPIVYWYTKRSWSQAKDFLQRFNVNYTPKLLHSYHIKTLYLYALERLPKDYWINGENMLKTILALIDELIVCLSIHECKHYFMPQVNLLKSTSNPIDPDFFPVVAKHLITERKKIMEDPAKYLFAND